MAGDDTESLGAVLFFFDQQLGEVLGVCLRFGWQDDEAAVVHRDLYSGGLNLSGSLWGREGYNAGIGYARLHEGNLDVDYTAVSAALANAATTF